MPHHEPEDILLREALTLLSPDFNHPTRMSNYGWPAIVAMLAKGGIEVSPSVLKKRLSERRDAAGMKGSREEGAEGRVPRGGPRGRRPPEASPCRSRPRRRKLTSRPTVR